MPVRIKRDSPRVPCAVVVEACVGGVLRGLELVGRRRRGRRPVVVMVTAAVVVVDAVTHGRDLLQVSTDFRHLISNQF